MSILRDALRQRQKRRLIDSCGHERCYSCLFRSEACPLCLYDAGTGDLDDDNDDNDDDDDVLEGPFRGGSIYGFSSGPTSVLASADDWIDDSSTVNSLCGSPRPRIKVTTRANLPPRSVHVSIAQIDEFLEDVSVSFRLATDLRSE